MSRAYMDLTVAPDDTVDVSEGGAVRVDNGRHNFFADADTHDRLALAHIEAARRIRAKSHLPLFDNVPA